MTDRLINLSVPVPSLGHHSGDVFDFNDSDGDVPMQDSEVRFDNIVAIDFGTTFSSVAYCRYPETTDPQSLRKNDIRCVDHYPDRPLMIGASSQLDERLDVPTELWYPEPTIGSVPGSRGSDLMQPPTSSANLRTGHDYDDSSDIAHMAIYSSTEEDGDVSSSDDDEMLQGGTGHAGEAASQPWAHRRNPYWGYSIQKKLMMTDTPRDHSKRLSRFKLMLDVNSEATKKLREDIQQMCKRLSKNEVIEHEHDLISDYLGKLLEHTKKRMHILGDYAETDRIHFVLCVPAVWSPNACLIMQDAMAKAIAVSRFGNLLYGHVDDLFIVSEPEAAATYILAENHHGVSEGDLVLSLDAGGGTVDAVLYKVTSSYPLRLQREMTSPSSSLCGGSFVNERLQEYLQTALEPETYLNRNGRTIETIIDAKVVEFENGRKRNINVNDKETDSLTIRIDDIRPNSSKNFEQNRVILKRENLKWLYKYSLDGVVRILKTQLDAAKERGLVVSSVLVMGGFGQSPSVDGPIRRVLAKYPDSDGDPPSLLRPVFQSAAVAIGAVLQAMNKENGPERITQFSYGFHRDEPHEPDLCPAHREVKPTIDKVDGERYVRNTIHWLIVKGELIPNGHERHIRSRHIFRKTKTRFICPETLFVSDRERLSHYRHRHPNNKGAEPIGQIKVDMSFLLQRDEFVNAMEGEGVVNGKRKFWVVEFDLFMIVSGRNLRWEARWPAQGDGKFSDQPSVQKGGQAQICIAAAFKPGTA